MPLPALTPLARTQAELLVSVSLMAREEGFEPSTYGFGDRHDTVSPFSRGAGSRTRTGHHQLGRLRYCHCTIPAKVPPRPIRTRHPFQTTLARADTCTNLLRDLGGIGLSLLSFPCGLNTGSVSCPGGLPAFASVGIQPCGLSSKLKRECVSTPVYVSTSRADFLRLVKS